MHIRYASVKFIQDGSEWDEFEKVVYPDREGVSLGFPNYEKAWEYLMTFEHDQATQDEVFGETSTEMPFIFKWDFEERDETDMHVIVWNASRGCAGLWRKIKQDW